LATDESQNLAALAAQNGHVAARGWATGDAFVLDIPQGIPAVWGAGNHVLWAQGEGCMIAGPQGVGKTSDGAQIAFGLAGVPGFEDLYGFPIQPLASGKRVMYLALDRPQQIARVFRRLASEVDPAMREVLRTRLITWQGPLPPEVANPADFAMWAVASGAGAVIVDSVKDLVTKPSDEEAGSHVNSVVQECIASGVQVLLLHHPRKANSDNRKPKTLDDIHGSGNLTRGLGSVIGLWGAAGDEEIEFTHLKQPAEVAGPYVIARDHDTGRSRVIARGTIATGAKADRARDVALYFRQAGAGMAFTKTELHDAGLGSVSALKPILAKLTKDGVLVHREGVGRGNPSTWRLSESGHESGQEVDNGSSHPLGEWNVTTYPLSPMSGSVGWE
jgi:hypothetical protein